MKVIYDLNEFLPTVESVFFPSAEEQARRDEIEYNLGFDQGARDLNLIQQTHGENGHTYEAYCAARARAEECYYTFTPTPYTRGYCDGADEVALCVKGEVEYMALILRPLAETS